MLIMGVIIAIVGVVQFRFRERWARQAKVILEGFGLTSWAAKPVEFWVRLEIAGNIFFWVAGAVMIVMGIVSITHGAG